MNEQAAQARCELLTAWMQGQRPALADLLQRHPALGSQSAALEELRLLDATLRKVGGMLTEQVTLPPPAPSGADPDATLAPATPVDPDATLAPVSTSSQPSEFPQVPGYEILGELGRGGMGVVYKARHLRLKRLVALKMILAGTHAGIAEMQRFRLEAEALASLQHPNIVQIHEIGEVDAGSGTPCPYFSLEFCSGGSLAGQLRELSDPEEAAAMVEILARAMHAAHEKGLIHRDLKPANVLLTREGDPKITDFGLARALEAVDAGPGQGPLTASGAILGTPSYMAPEQAAGKTRELGPACDIYALGAILYECLTGRPPFQGPTALDTLLQVLDQELVPVKQINRAVPRDLETICHKCLHKEPGRRYATGLDLAEDLERFQAGEPIHARPPGPLERANHWLRKNQTLAFTSLAVGLLGAVGYLGGLIPDRLPGLGMKLPLVLSLPAIFVVLRILVGAEGRWAGLSFLVLALPAGIWWWFSGLTGVVPLGPLLFTVPCVILAGLIGLGRARNALIASLFALLLLGLSVVAGLHDSIRVSHLEIDRFVAAFLVVGLHGMVLGLTARLVAWALGKKPDLIVLGSLVGAGIGLGIGAQMEGQIYSYLASGGIRIMNHEGIRFYLEVCLTYACAIVAGLLGSATMKDRKNGGR